MISQFYFFFIFFSPRSNIRKSRPLGDPLTSVPSDFKRAASWLTLWLGKQWHDFKKTCRAFPIILVIAEPISVNGLTPRWFDTQPLGMWQRLDRQCIATWRGNWASYIWPRGRRRRQGESSVLFFLLSSAGEKWAAPRPRRGMILKKKKNS